MGDDDYDDGGGDDDDNRWLIDGLMVNWIHKNVDNPVSEVT